MFFSLFQVYEDVSQCCQALSQRLGTQPFFFNKQYVSIVSVYPRIYWYLWVNLSYSAESWRNKHLMYFGRMGEIHFYTWMKWKQHEDIYSLLSHFNHSSRTIVRSGFGEKKSITGFIAFVFSTTWWLKWKHYSFSFTFFST